ncbi:hypothetical protein Q31a_27840 [Aureliella helgolandensis]|uniref:Uncharacterized protein n=1 Tax=Aureliella helgolandensis TaxID=2527968 RepID=A0A518G7A3_9BACT|nr:hypothetical protein Q31a_27840 [Aureliella helgolandensis]
MGPKLPRRIRRELKQQLQSILNDSWKDRPTGSLASDYFSAVEKTVGAHCCMLRLLQNDSGSHQGIFLLRRAPVTRLRNEAPEVGNKLVNSVQQRPVRLRAGRTVSWTRTQRITGHHRCLSWGWHGVHS